MITTNESKKVLVDKLLQDKVISLDDALVLLEEPEMSLGNIQIPCVQPSIYPVYPYPIVPIQPYYQWPYTVICGDGLSTSGTIVCGGGNITTQYVDMNNLPAGSYISYTAN